MKIYKRCNSCGTIIEVDIQFDKERGYIFIHDGKFYCSENCLIQGESISIKCDECDTEVEAPIKGSEYATGRCHICKICKYVECESRVEISGLYDKLRSIEICEACAKEQGVI